MHLVIGATGLLGGSICHLLQESGERVRALVRATSDPAKVAALSQSGIEVMYGDLKDPSSILNACKGTSSMVTTANSMSSRQPGDSIDTVDRRGYLSLMGAAKGAGVRRLIYISVPPGMKHISPFTRAKREIEMALFSSDFDYTILQPCAFLEEWLSPPMGFDYINARATIYGAGENPVAWISYHDVAAAAVHCLSEAGTVGKRLPLGGPENLSPHEVVRLFEQALGRSFHVRHLSEEELQAQKSAAPDPIAESFAALLLDIAAGLPMDAAGTRSLLPGKLTTVAEYAASIARATVAPFGA